MSRLTKKDFRNSSTTANAEKIIGVICRAFHEQATAADATSTLVGGGPAIHTGKVQSAFVVVSASPGSGESMSYDLQVNGASILTAPLVLNDVNVGGVDSIYFDGDQIPLPVEADTVIESGDVITVVRDYTAGGTPTPIANNVVAVEWA